MSIIMCRVYTFTCDFQDGTHGRCWASCGDVIPAWDAQPTPAAAARREAVALGFHSVSRGNNRGWLVFCEQHWRARKLSRNPGS